MNGLGDRGENVWTQGRSRTVYGAVGRTRNRGARVGDHLCDRLAHRLGRSSRKYSAIDIGADPLGQGVGGVTAFDHRRHAGRPKLTHERGVAGQDLDGRHVFRVREEPA